MSNNTWGEKFINEEKKEGLTGTKTSENLALLDIHVTRFLRTFHSVVLPTLRGVKEYTMSHHEYCLQFREFMESHMILNEHNARYPRALHVQAALAPYKGINQLLLKRRVQLVLPDSCVATYRRINTKVPPVDYNPRKSKHTKPGPPQQSEFDNMFERGKGTKRNREQ